MLVYTCSPVFSPFSAHFYPLLHHNGKGLLSVFLSVLHTHTHTHTHTGTSTLRPKGTPEHPPSPPPRVLFTGVVDKEGERTLWQLGGELVHSVYECTHLVTDKVHLQANVLGMHILLTCTHGRYII